MEGDRGEALGLKNWGISEMSASWRAEEFSQTVTIWPWSPTLNETECGSIQRTRSLGKKRSGVEVLWLAC